MSSPSDSNPTALPPSGHPSLDLPSLHPLSHDHPLLSSDQFDVDAFLLSRVWVPLDELRGELREYLGILREELVQLINDDYEEFISLGTGLRGEGDRLRGLEQPLTGLCGEIETVRDVLLTHQEAVQSKLEERAALREERALLDLLQRLFETLSRAETLLAPSNPSEPSDRSKLVARVAGEYTQLVYLVNKAKSEKCELVQVVSPRVDSIRRSLSTDLSNILLGTLDDKHELKVCLRTYELIEGWKEAEEVIRRSVRDFCEHTITPSALTAPSSSIPKTPHTPATFRNPFDPSPQLSEPTPLAALYNQVLTHLTTYQPLMNVAEGLNNSHGNDPREGEKGFDFFGKVIWPEVSGSIASKLGNVIFAAGRPDELHKHYTTTYNFISLLETLAPSQESIISMRQSESYEAFSRRWQLPVYFQLRWKEIVGSLENTLTSPPLSGEPKTPSRSMMEKEATGEGEWNLTQSQFAWKAFERCWSEDVYVPELAARFWRLSLQIVSRYGRWLQTTLETFKVGDEDTRQEDAALRFVAAGIIDVDLFVSKVRGLDVLKGVDFDDLLNLPSYSLISTLLSILVRRCSEPLKLIRSIASQFRASPSSSTQPTPSHFIPTIFKPLQELLNSLPTLKEKYGCDWSSQVVDTVCTNYATILSSVRKTEDLLRRHRKSKKGTFGFFSGGGGGGNGEEEEERFGRQMKVDLEGLQKELNGLGVDVELESLNGWRELRDVVERPGE
ncbi:hypothetical protein M231_04805 [Tremella mesenterica]|uniref:Conserved oligomeric Golgi complex subunit 2 n=1 Tax=Tremella mesenterica TaxID=5217 RepID=A0A4Q1BJS4_TREME|nr:hypothetical protein M231_04805 [Tremella mesenterica]